MPARNEPKLVSETTPKPYRSATNNLSVSISAVGYKYKKKKCRPISIYTMNLFTFQDFREKQKIKIEVKHEINNSFKINVFINDVIGISLNFIRIHESLASVCPTLTIVFY